jgi:hypothetical protein
MLFTQFFGLFVLASQLVILFIVFIKLSKESKIQFIYKSLLSGFILMMIFVPAITIFIETTKKKYTSIQPTTADTIIQIFRDFFQDSNYLIAIATFLIVLFLFFIFKDKLYKNKKQSFVLLILFSWILITLILPIIRSYLVSPMIISRYFITILPPIIILIAMGIDKINTKIIKITVVLIFVFASFFELIYFYDYYNKIAKTQFREITEYVKKENPENDPVVSNLSWYLLYFFNNNQNKTQVVDRIFEDHVQDMIKDSTTINSFWYFGAFGNPLKLSDKSQEFIDEKFVVAHSLDKFDSWTKHYVKKSNQNLRYYSIPLESITLSNINDSNWFNGVSTKNNILLIDFSIKNRYKFSRTAFLKFKNNKIVKIIKTEQVGNFIYLHVDQNIFLYKELIKYPTTIEILYNE